MANTLFIVSNVKHYNETIIFQQMYVKVYLQAKDMKHCIVLKWQRCCEISIQWEPTKGHSFNWETYSEVQSYVGLYG